MGLTSWLRGKVRDDAGHEHDSDGRFTGGAGGPASASADEPAGGGQAPAAWHDGGDALGSLRAHIESLPTEQQRGDRVRDAGRAAVREVVAGNRRRPEGERLRGAALRREARTAARAARRRERHRQAAEHAAWKGKLKGELKDAAAGAAQAERQVARAARSEAEAALAEKLQGVGRWAEADEGRRALLPGGKWPKGLTAQKLAGALAPTLRDLAADLSPAPALRDARAALAGARDNDELREAAAALADAAPSPERVAAAVRDALPEGFADDGLQEAVAAAIPYDPETDPTGEGAARLAGDAAYSLTAAVREALLKGAHAGQPRKGLTVSLRNPPASRTRHKDTIGVPTLQIDPARMYARAIISTGALDREWEVVVPRGCDLEAYGKGPAPVFFNHQQLPFPVGSSKQDPRDPACPLDVQVEDEAVAAGCWFNQASPEAEVVFRLYELGHIGATSVGFQSKRQTEITGAEAEEMGAPYRVVRHEEWELVEWSWVGVGCNREALAMHLARGRVGGKAIPETLKKAFAPYALPRKFFGAGAELPPPAGQSRKAIPPAARKGKAMDDTEQTVKPPAHEMIEGMLKDMAQVCRGVAEKLPAVDPQLADVRRLALGVCRTLSESMDAIGGSMGEVYEGLELPEEVEGLDYSELDAADAAEPAEGEEAGDEDDADEEHKDDEPDDADEGEDDEEMKALTEEFLKAKRRLKRARKQLAEIEG